MSTLGTIASATHRAQLVVVEHELFSDLVDEAGSVALALDLLVRVAIENDRPIGVNFPRDDDTSEIKWFAPDGWADERLQGWIAAYHGELESDFGNVLEWQVSE